MNKQKPRKAPKVEKPSSPNYMREADKTKRRISPMAPMVNKRLSK